MRNLLTILALAAVLAVAAVTVPDRTPTAPQPSHTRLVSSSALATWNIHGTTVSRRGFTEVRSDWNSVKGLRVQVKRGSGGPMSVGIEWRCTGFAHVQTKSFSQRVEGARWYNIQLRSISAPPKGNCWVYAHGHSQEVATNWLRVQYN